MTSEELERRLMVMEDNKHLSNEQELTYDNYILQQENQQLKANWNELKGWLKANDIHYAEAIPFKETLRKMEELEKESDVK